ncbi:MAG: hypothetical protein JRI23_07565, partial [Deltaproteobacteria bacterium]|nr:hypothetical protein [Deltaproteobacteria bacterium]MBW2531450.1 hypothetical protein [Deltaproteobacteria bacterium]
QAQAAEKAAARAARPKPAAARKPRPASTADRPVSPARKLYDQYVAAKKAGGESTKGLTFQKMARSLQKQTDKLRQKHGNRKIDYEVVTKDGRTQIRPKIK